MSTAMNTMGTNTSPDADLAGEESREVLTGVWADLAGQEQIVSTLRAATRSANAGAEPARGAGPSAGAGMTHAWLFTGPPGSGRSNAARAFAAGLQCERQGCGECSSCRTALAGSNPDVTLVRTDQLSLRVDQIRELVVKAAMTPVGERWQVLVVEDADRLTEQAADALLKSLEEPPARTVWVLCAPTVTDVVPTIRSRCRLLVLRTPSPASVADLLRRRVEVDEQTALFAARASQGHVGRARALATDAEVLQRRREVLSVPDRLGTVPACLQAAQELVDASNAEAKQTTDELDAKEQEELERAVGLDTKGVKPRHAQAAVRELQEQQKVRAKRLQRDALDRALLDLMSFYRDVLAVALGASGELVNEERRDQIRQRAQAGGPEPALRAIDAILACREAVSGNVAPQLAVETMMLALRH